MKNLPNTKNALILRTDFSDNSAWDSIRTAIEEPVGEFRFRAHVDFLSDPEYTDITLDDLLVLIPPSRDDLPLILPVPGYTFIFIVDQRAISEPEHPILVIDLSEERGRSFRAIPSAIQTIENNLSNANMDFDEFADFTDPDGIFRAFDVQ
jgi:hypothetical protein